jgi:hypothetical protein
MKSILPRAGAALLLLFACVVAWIAFADGCSTPEEAPAPPRIVAAPPAPAPAPAATAPSPPATEAPRTRATDKPRSQPPSPPPPEASQPTAPIEPEDVVVEGRIVDAAGAPIVGATVAATTFRVLADRGAKPPSRGAATTEAEGTFRARLPKDTVFADVAASAAGFAPASVERVRVGAPIEIRLEREGVLTGLVLDPVGGPIAGAAVRLFRVLGHAHVDVAAATTSADGEYRIGGFGTAPWKNPFKEPLSTVLDVRAAGFAVSQDYGPFPTKAGATTLRDVVLHPARPLTVEVVDADAGKPLAGARVTVGLHARGLEVRGAGEEPSFVPHPAPYVDEGVSDENGVCVLANTPSRLTVYQRLIVRAWKQGFTAEAFVLTARPRVDDERVDVRLWPSATVKGRVVDATGAPVPGAIVTSDGLDKLWDVSFSAPFGDRPWGGTFRTTGVPTDADGRYVLPGVRAGVAGTVIAYVWTLGRREPLPDGRSYVLPHWNGAAGERPPGVELRLRAGEESSAPDLVVPAPKPTSAAVFVVVDEAGRPVADARLENTNAVGSPAWTDVDGRVTLRWGVEPEWRQKPETEAVVHVSAGGLVNATARCRPDVEFPPEVRVVLSRGTRIEGRVHELDGRPAVGWTVTAWRSQGDHVTYGGAQTADDGTFAIDGVPASPMDLEITHIGEASDAGRQVQFAGALAGGAPVDIVLRADTTRYGALIVTTVDAIDGAPIVEKHVYVACRPNAVGEGWFLPGPPGVASFARVPVGTWTVRATAKGWLAGDTTVTIEEGQATRVSLALVAAAPAVVRLIAPVPLRTASGPFTVWAARVDAAPGEKGAGVQVSSRDFDREGVTLRFDALPMGKYRLGCSMEAAGESGRYVEYVATAPIEVGPPGKTTARATLTLVVGGMIKVAVRDPAVPRWSSEPAVPSTAAIEVVAVGGERHCVVTSVTDRGWSVPLLPGAYVVRLLLQSGRLREAQATVRAGETAVVRFDSPK